MKFTLSKDRLVVIVTDKAAPEPVRFAADELGRYLGRILGADIRVGSNAPSGNPVIQLEIVADDALTDEGYALVAENSELFYIRGGGPAGVVFGVYDFLRRYGGCRFSGYAPEGEYVPRRERIEIPADMVRMQPKLWYRGLQFNARTTDTKFMVKRLDWMAKNSMNYVSINVLPDLPEFETSTTTDPQTGQVIVHGAKQGFTNAHFRKHLLPEVVKRGLKLEMNNHNLFFWLPPEKYYAEHPEWYALVNGERSRKPEQLCVCTSNRQAVETLIKNVLQYLRANPEVRIVGVIPEDGLGMCQCAECRKLDVNPTDADRLPGNHRSPDTENKSKTRRYALLLNEVARAVRAEFPQIKVGGAAYVDLQWPPRDVVLERNIVMWVAIYWRCGAHELGPDACQVNRFFWGILEQWRRSQPCEIILYEYYMGMNCQKGLPYPVAAVIAREWPRLQTLGIGGATVQSREHDHNTYALNYLAFARSGWEDRVDYAALKTEFLQGMFGSLAEAMRPVYETFERQVKMLEAKGLSSPFVQPWSPKEGCLLPNSLNIVFLLEALDVPAAIARIEAAMRKTSDKRECRQAKDFLDALRYWHMAADLYRTARAIMEAEGRGENETVKRLARQALQKNEPVLKQIEALPPRGWIRTFTYFSEPRCDFWRKDDLGELPWMEKKAGMDPRPRCAP